MKYIPYCFLLLIILSPLVGLGILSVNENADVFVFLVKNVLLQTVLNSAFIVTVVLFGTFVIGTMTAWFVTRYQFFGSRILQIMLLTPLAFPAYIVAYAYTDMLDLIITDIRSPIGAAFIMIFCLYPYVYIFARNGFMKQAQNQIEAATLMGASPWQQFWTVALPAARPAILVGLSLVAMETLADYGTVSYFGVRVFSTVIYNAWAGYGDIYAAARLSLILLSFMIVLLFLERQSRRRIRFFDLLSSGNNTIPKKSVNGLQSIFLPVFCLLPVIAGFVVPFSILIKLTIDDMLYRENVLDIVTATLPYISNTLILAITAAVIGIVIAIGLAVIKRDSPSIAVARLYQISGFGYALPGVILGLGLLSVSGFVQNQLGWILSGTFIFLIAGYVIRFLAIPLQSFDAAFEKISPTIDQASKLLRKNKLSELWHIRLVLLRPAIMSAFLLLVVDVIKELPLTLILRPFNFDTLAVHAYHLAADERLSQAAFPSLLIALSGLIAVLILSRFMKSA